jgi:hypothetical protein
MSNYDRFNDQFRETLTERNERLRTSRLKESIRTLQQLVADLSDDLRDEGCYRPLNELNDMRRRVATALPPDLCPEWLARYREPGITQS